ncbi:tRNA uridine-5-carboxymethylaminomethyl(34) synthesis GTPase MnmE [Aestuariispira insulae]|uniref:tRNA modification GTPase MnmE n=1 Tax=Aestuariispira insulae TaxID=1461337 RepID=A0A3D9HR29_9PROT|nr:tRNA uridine-5-carboxymethylaminomethyl(34) synthesis GTPase MnmE [Aestuariispira insulae]RED51356.1 tRNA modification GTPase trmE [Aestuariispira insulae]
MAQTIYALASGKGRAGVAVIRISGPDTDMVLNALLGGTLPSPRKAVRAWLRDPDNDELIDDGLVLRFCAPASYTGEDVAEIHIHGGRAIQQRLFQVLDRQPGLRMAEPGEFTKRAFGNGKMDLTEAEGVIDLIDAETEAQRQQALRQVKGELGDLYHQWAERITRILAYYEAEIDFADEDLPDDIGQETKPQISELIALIDNHLNDNRRGERLRDGVHIALIGPPNAGKSSLLNLLAQREAAIVSDIAGTTRDVLEVHLDLGGFPVVVSDTAGLRDTDDVIEKEGVRRAVEAAERSDICVLVVDLSDPTNAERGDIARYMEVADLVVFNKTDRTDGISGPLAPKNNVKISVKDGSGVSEMLANIGSLVESRFGLTEAPVITRERHRSALVEARENLARALTAPEVSLAAEDLRMALRAVGRITGRVGVEELLDVIFRDFCIGK